MKQSLVESALFRIYRPVAFEPVAFLRWWYGDMLRRIVLLALYGLARVEDVFSFWVMIKQLVTLQPLHQDYAIIGRAIGVVVRLMWVAAGILVMAVALVVCLIGVLAWLVLPWLPVWALWMTLS